MSKLEIEHLEVVSTLSRTIKPHIQWTNQVPDQKSKPKERIEGRIIINNDTTIFTNIKLKKKKKILIYILRDPTIFPNIKLGILKRNVKKHPQKEKKPPTRPI